MCNVEDDGERQPLKETHIQSAKGLKCVKCDQPGVLITRIHDAFCKTCFQVYVVHKFRSAIGKSKLIRDGEQVLVAFSGGTNSSALLHLIQDGLSVRAHKKLRFTPTLLHVDECGMLDMSESSRQELREKVIQLMLKSGFPSYLTDLEQAVNIERKKQTTDGKTTVSEREKCHYQLITAENYGSALSPPTSSQTEKLKSLIASLASKTSKEDFFRNLRNQLIVSVARHLGFTKVLTAECSTRLSIRILTDVAQGRGSQVALNTGFSDQRNSDIMFVRPVRDLNAKELAMYNSLFEVDSVFIPSMTTKGVPFASIERLTETFVTGLQADFPSTVSNIVRTSEKLGLPDLQTSSRCSFCQSPLDTNVGKASALHAVEFSQKLSRSAQKGRETTNGTGSGAVDGQSSSPYVSDPENTCCGQGDGSCHGNKELSVALDELNQYLCYGCHLSLDSFGPDTSLLPSFITKEVTETKQRERLREQISEFLLEDDNDDR